MTPLLLLHGFTGSPRSWAPVREQLPPRFAVVAPALLGHDGSSAGPEIGAFLEEAERVLALLPEGGKAHVAGYSLGARLALALLVRHPERFEQATLVSAHPGLATADERETRRRDDRRWRALLETGGIEAFVAAWEAQTLWTSEAELPEAMRRARRLERLGHTPSGLARSLAVCGLGEMPDLRPLLGRVALRVTVMAGERDPKFLCLARELSSRLPRAALDLVPAAGHNLLLERPQRVAAAIGEGTS